MRFEELKDYEGVDADLETSLFEYGLIWHEEEDGAYKFIYGVDMAMDETGEWVYNLFDYAYMSAADFKELVEESWFGLDRLLKSFGLSSKNEFIKGFPWSVYEAVAYQGAENIFGSSYYPFKIEGVQE